MSQSYDISLTRRIDSPTFVVGFMGAGKTTVGRALGAVRRHLLEPIGREEPVTVGPLLHLVDAGHELADGTGGAPVSTPVEGIGPTGLTGAHNRSRKLRTLAVTS